MVTLASFSHSNFIFPSFLILFPLMFTISAKIFFFSTSPLEITISLESMMLLTTLVLSLSVAFPSMPFYLLFFTLSVSEAGVALGVFIVLTRNKTIQFKLCPSKLMNY